jgi:hypothetical protein
LTELYGITVISVLVSGSPMGKKRLCEGDSLSPFLFNIAAEGLNKMLKNIVNWV